MLSVIVPAWIHSPELTNVARECIRTFKLHAGQDVELVAINNGGYHADAVKKAITPYADKQIDWSFNQGYPKAVNAGLEAATGDTLVIASMDILLPPNWAKPFVDAMPQIASVREHRDDAKEQRHIAHRGAYWPAVVALPREAYNAVGGMDETYEGFADREYGMRLWDAGFNFCRVPVEGKHLASNHAYIFGTKNHDYAKAHARAMRRLKRAYGTDNWLDYCNKHPRLMELF